MLGANDRASFIRAVRGGDTAAARSLAANTPSLVGATDPDCFGATPLIHAVGTGDRAMVDLLLELGAEIDQRSDWWAGSFGVLDNADDEMSAYLLTRGAALTPHAAARLGMIDRLRAMLDRDASVVHARGGDGQMPLHFARTVEIAELLLSRGADIDARDIDHASTAAQWLCGSRPEVAAYLVSRGATADPFLAARTGDVALLEKLVAAEPDGVKVRIKRERFVAAPPAAGHIYLYTIGEGCGLVHAAAESDRGGVIRWLAAYGADMNVRAGYDDATPLHVAAWNDKPEATAALVDCGAEINAKSGQLHNNEPIGWAIVGGSPKVFGVLLERGATVRPNHIEDARKGAEGAFREFNPKRPLDAWRRIAEVLAREKSPRA
ncbi:MAG: ankyrin repeat domain-containing protein [Phycisphaerales bacterium]